MTDLTTLPRAKAWLGLQETTGSDATVRRLISAASTAVLSYIERDSFDVVERDERYDGGGAAFMLLRESPVIEISALEIDGAGTFPLYSNGGRGYRLAAAEPGDGRQRLSLVNAIFPIGIDNVRARYRTGRIVEETIKIPAVEGNAARSLYAPNRPFLRDLGVSKAGEALTDYEVEDGIYSFPAAQAGDEVVLRFSVAPADIENCVIEILGETFKRKERIGQTSAVLGPQQTVHFSQKDFPPGVKTVLDTYLRSAPL